MSVCCDCCVLSGRGLCDELITRPEESYRLWFVVVCDLQTSSRMRRPWPTGRGEGVLLLKKKMTEKCRGVPVLLLDIKLATFSHCCGIISQDRTRASFKTKVL